MAYQWYTSCAAAGAVRYQHELDAPFVWTTLPDFACSQRLLWLAAAVVRAGSGSKALEQHRDGPEDWRHGRIGRKDAEPKNLRQAVGNGSEAAAPRRITRQTR